MNRLAVIVQVSLFSSLLLAQSRSVGATVDAPVLVARLAAEGKQRLPTAPASLPDLAPAVSVPRMSPDLALSTYFKRTNAQARALAGYSSATLIRAELPSSAQHGEFELERHYTAPRTLTFKALHYMGDAFVKTNVIARVLQSELDHVQKDDPAVTAITRENYRFSHQTTIQLAGCTVHVYQVKPHKKRLGLFKGHIYLDASTGSLVRAEGRVVKSPSIFVKKIDFVQDYADIKEFTLPVHLHSEAKATLVGRTIVDIENRDYQAVPAQAGLESASGSGAY